MDKGQMTREAPVGGSKAKGITFPFTLGLLILCSPMSCQTVKPPYEVATWRGFRTSAVSLTFDDGCPNQFSVAIPMLHEFGYASTLFTVTGSRWVWPADWTRLKSAAANGHEVASHTATHTAFGGMNGSLQKMELRDSREEINAHIPGHQCITMAYPFCVTGDGSIVAQYYIAARICSGAVEPSTPSDFLNISSITCGSEGPIKSTQDFIGTVRSAVYSEGWCVFMLHGIDNDGGWSPFPSDTLRKCLEYLRANPDQFWVTTFADAVRYIKERNSVSISEKVVTGTSLTVRVTDMLDNSIFNVPITLRRRLPDGWHFANVTQSYVPIQSRIVTIDRVCYVQFDTVPDCGDLIITKSDSPDIQSNQR